MVALPTLTLSSALRLIYLATLGCHFFWKNFAAVIWTHCCWVGGTNAPRPHRDFVCLVLLILIPIVNQIGDIIATISNTCGLIINASENRWWLEKYSALPELIDLWDTTQRWRCWSRIMHCCKFYPEKGFYARQKRHFIKFKYRDKHIC